MQFNLFNWFIISFPFYLMFHLLFIYLFFIVIVIITLRLLEIKGNVLSLPLMNRYFQTSFKETFTFISNFYKQTFIFSRCTKLQFCVFFIICSCSTFIGAERYYLFFSNYLPRHLHYSLHVTKLRKSVYKL